MSTLKLAVLLASAILLGCRSPKAAQGEPSSEAQVATFDYDCNGNGVEDAVDISIGSSSDANANGIPDECEDALVQQTSP